MTRLPLPALAAAILAACGGEPPAPPQPEPTGAASDIAPWTAEAAPVGQATAHTAARNKHVAERLPLSDRGSFEEAERGFIARIEADAIRDADGNVVWAVDALDFVAGDAPPTVNPSLWRQSKLTAMHGLFEVTDGLYQVRGYDLAVMSLIRGETGWIVVDPLTVKETAAAGLKLANDALGARPVSAVIYTHSHVDHFGGVRGVVDEADVASGRTPIIAPAGFSEEAVSENLLAGPHMSRRAALMFGRALPRSAAGHVGSGLGPGLPNGIVGLIPPTEEIPRSGGERTIDGVRFEFIDAGGAEAPAEFIFFLPDFNALCSAEIVTATFHNILTMRGAKARDALAWSRIIDDVIERFGDRADILFASHHWPAWGREAVRSRLEGQRDIYRYVHDQTLRLANSGARPAEIAETLPEPAFLTDDFAARGYYGSLAHNAKAVNQFYFGWWDGVPATFNQHPPEARATRFVAAVGGPAAALDLGKSAFAEGDYRWAAEVLNHLVFADGTNAEARSWLAAAYEQMGFQAESGAWRSYFLAAARELRVGPAPTGELGNEDFLKAVPSLQLFDALASRYDPALLDREPYALEFQFTDTGETLAVEIGAAVAYPRPGPAEAPAATFITTRAAFNNLILRETNALLLMGTGKLRIDGDRAAVTAFFDALPEPDLDFDLVTP